MTSQTLPLKGGADYSYLADPVPEQFGEPAAGEPLDPFLVWLKEDKPARRAPTASFGLV